MYYKLFTLLLSCLIGVSYCDDIYINNNSTVRVLVWIDGEPALSMNRYGKHSLSGFAYNRAEFKIELDLVPDDFIFSSWNINVLIEDQKIAEFSRQIGNLKSGSKETVTIAKTNKPQLKFEALEANDIAILKQTINRLLLAGKKEDPSNILFKADLNKIINKKVIDWWTDSAKMQFEADTKLEDIEFIQGKSIVVIRISANAKHLKDRGIFRFIGEESDVNYIECMIVAKTKKDGLITLCNDKWLSLTPPK